MGISLSLLLALNNLFKTPVHPFNLRADGKSTYAEWQFEKGAQTLAWYTAKFSESDILRDKTVLDVGCGAAGKSLYYASRGARRVVGLDVVDVYRDEALELARKKSLEDRFAYVCADAADTGFESGSFDAVILNDAVEHVADPPATLRECLRLLAPGGRLYLNFPPYYHPYGAHLSDAVVIPWVHAFFSEKTMIAAYKKLVNGLPDGAARTALRFSAGPDGKERISYINRMTVRRFYELLRGLPAKLVYYHEEPLRGFLCPLTRLPAVREFFIKMVVAVLEPSEPSEPPRPLNPP